ncbi:unnamed protein product [Hydatigera taeniaeformis]|uniref:Prospero domain-containing protein n=1 Tax=Hydatigena taeniaeformis TaxID=6205 RepID=A0A0R3WZL9_HYDTA|nr:unnamed protein product [Hydatigera taeniaeformis]
MTFFGNVKLLTVSAPDQCTSVESEIAAPSKLSNRLQFCMSPLKAVYVVPPPSLLLNSPMLMQAGMPLRSWIEGGSRSLTWNQELEAGQGDDFCSKTLELSMQQIENRLSENGIGKASIWKRQNNVSHKEPHAPPKRLDNLLLEEPMNLSFHNAKSVSLMAVPRISALQHILKGEVLNGQHLRKAKLMFLYARYPSSAYLKHFFPEVTFSRYNTAQLIKWFSNFREFFYINIERCARSLVAEGVRSPKIIQVIPKLGLYRTLIFHYNRSMECETPAEFFAVIERALLEFFLAIVTGGDSHSAWKKKIYKTIAQFDQTIPERFRYLKC